MEDERSLQEIGETARRILPDHLMNKLTPKQRKFVVNWNGDPKSSLEAAGYKATSPSAISGAMLRLMKVGEIRLLIDNLNESLEGAAIASVAEIRSFWTSVLRNEDTKITERIAASKLLGQAHGIFSDKLIVQSHHTEDKTLTVIVQSHAPINDAETAELNRLESLVAEDQQNELQSMQRPTKQLIQHNHHGVGGGYVSFDMEEEEDLTCI